MLSRVNWFTYINSFNSGNNSVYTVEEQQLAKMVMVRLSCPHPLTLLSCSVNMTWHGYVTAGIIYSNAHGHHDVLAWPHATFVLYTYISTTWNSPGNCPCLLLAGSATANKTCLQLLLLLVFSSSFPDHALYTWVQAKSETYTIILSFPF